MEELTAYDRNLGIGDQVIIGPDETLFPARYGRESWNV